MGVSTVTTAYQEQWNGIPDPAQPDLTKLVISRYTRMSPDEVRVGPLQRNYFSMLYTLALPGAANLVVKIPKTDLRVRSGTGVLPLTAADRALGRSEYDSLRVLSSTWRGDDVRVRWVRPVGYVDEYNAVITELVDASEVWRRYVRLATARLRGDRAAGQILISSLSRIGTALARFHRTHASPAELEGEPLSLRLRGLFGRFQRLGINDPLDRRLRGAIDRIGKQRWPVVETVTLKGIDIRNILQAPDDSIWIVDPGKMKRGVPEADLSRFLFTWRILFWGTPWFALLRLPHPSIESAFLSSYDAVGQRDPGLLNAFLLKEALKHWNTARESLALKPWSWAKRNMVRVSYIDPFYRRQLNELLNALA